MKTELAVSDDVSASGSLNTEQRSVMLPRKQGGNLLLLRTFSVVCHSGFCSCTRTHRLMRYSQTDSKQMGLCVL